MKLNTYFDYDIPILAYHKVDTRWELGETWVTPKQFENHIKYLSENGYQSLKCSQLLEPLPNSPIVVITFDDAYQNFYQYAFPILEKYNFSSTVFVISDYIGKANRWDAVLAGRYFNHLNITQLKELASNELVEFGSHSVNHYDLTTLSEEKIYYELMHSKKFLEDILQYEITSFSYPFGRYNEQIERFVEDCNYKMAFTLVKGKGESLFNLRRRALYRTDTLMSLRIKVREAGFSQWNWYEDYKGRIINGVSFLSGIYKKLTNL